jgi:uncharacterized membrane protein
MYSLCKHVDDSFKPRKPHILAFGAKKVSFEYNRAIGRAGTLLIVSTPVVAVVIAIAAFFFGFLQNTLLFAVVPLSYSGQALFLVAMNRFANYYETRAIFRNALYGFTTSLASSIVSFFLTFGTFSYLRDLLESIPGTPSSPPPVSVVVAVIAFFAVIWLVTSLVALVTGFFYRRAFYALAEKSGEHNFRQAGFFLFIGGILTIIAIGALLFLVGWIFAVLGFFSMKPKASQASAN